MNRLLFAYGTLQSRSRHAAAERLRSVSRVIGPAAAQACLYQLGSYPGLVLSDRPQDIVSGELIELFSVEITLAWLDEYEGLAYTRQIITVTQHDGAVTSAWCYVYIDPVDDARRILSGVWLVP